MELFGPKDPSTLPNSIEEFENSVFDGFAILPEEEKSAYLLDGISDVSIVVHSTLRP